MLKEAAKSKKKKSSNKGDEDDSEGEEMAMMRQQMLEEQAKNSIEEEEVDEEEMRVHEGLNTIAHSWARPLTLRQERRRLKKYMEIKKPGFNTRVCAQSNPSIDTSLLRRDHTDLREIKRKRKAAKTEKTMDC